MSDCLLILIAVGTLLAGLPLMSRVDDYIRHHVVSPDEEDEEHSAPSAKEKA